MSEKSPASLLVKERNSEKLQRWNEKLRELEQVTDTLGEPIENGIKETVAGLQLVGFPTAQSCEGHADWGVPYPWVDVKANDEPSQRWEGEQEMRAAILTEFHIKPEEISKAVLHRGIQENGPEFSVPFLIAYLTMPPKRMNISIGGKKMSASQRNSRIL